MITFSLPSEVMIHIIHEQLADSLYEKAAVFHENL
jgi:hypothetical protein